ncbi:MAG: 2-oxoglutarate and iron-dependent oxygenase domain-containing protein [Deltaproteobacteria bacterium]|nr:2-oxoglutarate and iron-dependent oxygenase domain-containing protein [Deltaproteobacteria bacterium]
MAEIPIIDVAALIDGSDAAAVAVQLGAACRAHGFFYVVGHGVDPLLRQRVEELARVFFAQDLDTKRRIAMAHGGRAWRGYFAVGDELTSGVPDQKEGLYVGSELAADHPLVRAGTPLHGPNLFPREPAGLAPAVLAYMDALTRLGHQLMAGLALSLGLDASYFPAHGTAEPLLLFRIFNYPALASAADWSVGEHTDYGLLTILAQDDAGGLEIRTRHGWIAAPPLPGAFVCNIGDMLDRMTRGIFRSTPHRVRNTSGRDRLSLAFFFDPNFFARVQPIALDEPAPPDDRADRWDQASVHAFDGTYGDYVLAKVGRVFPGLWADVLPEE